MEYTIFYSWQSEKSDVTDFIREQLINCSKQLSEEYRVAINVKDADSDNRGSYNINTAVIKGIDNADIVVADLTPTSHGADGRANPNSNSLYEYAYACSKKGFENVIAVADVSIDSTRDMPFDWNHNALVTLNGVGDNKFNAALGNAIERILSAMLNPKLYNSTTEFFSLRIAQSFPGIRGIKVYEDPHEIRLHLGAFFKRPIRFGESLDAEGDNTPIWWFRGGSAEGIQTFSISQNGIYHIGWNEFKVKRIIVYAESSTYYAEYIYIETEPLPPISPEMTDERIEQIKDTLGYCDEEYAVVSEGLLSKNVTRQEYDDGYTEFNGEIIPITGKAELRCRFLTPYNFVVAAKFSSINCREFDMATHDLFNEILNDSTKFDELHNIIIKLPKPLYRGR